SNCLHRSLIWYICVPLRVFVYDHPLDLVSGLSAGGGCLHLVEVLAMIASPWVRPFRHRWFPRRAERRVLVRRVRPCFEVLEDRTVPAVFSVGAGDVNGLINAINAANSNGQSSNTIFLFRGTYNLTTVNNYWYGPDGLPAISSNLTIEGRGSIIQRAIGADNFRLFCVSGGLSGLPAGTLTLQNLTLDGGVAHGGDSRSGGGGLGAGGAIFNQGTLIVTDVTLTNNTAFGGSSGVAGLGNGGGGMGQNASTS